MSTGPRSGRIRTLSASSRARRAQRKADTHRRRLMAGGAALAVLIAAPLSITAFMGVDSSFPGLDAAKSLMALLEDRSPGDRTAAELTKTKKKPEQRALGKSSKPEPPAEFVEAIAPPPPALGDVPPFPVTLAGLGPLVEIPGPPPGGGGFITTTETGGGGGGGGGGGETENPPEEPPIEEPPEEPPVTPPVPEPGTWATMLLGFGLTGWLIRRRRRRDGAAAWA
jgi:hypothetical protein